MAKRMGFSERLDRAQDRREARQKAAAREFNRKLDQKQAAWAATYRLVTVYNAQTGRYEMREETK